MAGLQALTGVGSSEKIRRCVYASIDPAVCIRRGRRWDPHYFERVAAPRLSSRSRTLELIRPRFVSESRLQVLACDQLRSLCPLGASRILRYAVVVLEEDIECESI